MVKIRQIHKAPRFSKRHLLVFALFFGLIGGYFIWKSLAAPNPNLPSDLNNDNTVNILDLSILLSNYNTNNSIADINKDGVVNILDLSILLSNYGNNYTPPSSSAPLLGFFPGNQQHPDWMPDVQFLGKSVPLGEIFLDGGSYTASGWNMKLSLENYLGYWSSYPYRMIISIPTLVSGETLAQCATGQYDTYYTAIGQDLVNLGYSHSIIRLGWEFNGTWYGSQDANTDPTNWVTCFQHESSALKAADSNVMIDFNASAGTPAWNGSTPFDWRSVYPGDQYIDIIGLDVYDQGSSYPQGTDNNPSSVGGTAAALANEEANWNNIVNEQGGLQDQVDFAALHNKKLSIPEWGVTSGGYDQQDGGDDPYYVQQMANWMTEHGYYYESYFNLNASDGDHNLSDFPNSLAEFTKDFTPLVNQSPNNVTPVK